MLFNYNLFSLFSLFSLFCIFSPFITFDIVSLFSLFSLFNLFSLFRLSRLFSIFSLFSLFSLFSHNFNINEEDWGTIGLTISNNWVRESVSIIRTRDASASKKRRDGWLNGSLLTYLRLSTQSARLRISRIGLWKPIHHP